MHTPPLWPPDAAAAADAIAWPADDAASAPAGTAKTSEAPTAAATNAAARTAGRNLIEAMPRLPC